MKDIIAQIKNENGNSKMPVKDMLWYIVAKTDKIDEKLDKISHLTAVHKHSIKKLWWALGVLIALIAALRII